MNLTLTLKQKFADEIFAGTKDKEYREIRPQNAKKYCEFDENGDLTGAKPIKTITFYVGRHQKGMPYFTIEVLSSEIELFEDKDGELIVYEHEEEEYIQAQIVYSLGKILNKHNC